MSRVQLNRHGFRLYERFRPDVPAASQAGVRWANSTSRRSGRPGRERRLPPVRLLQRIGLVPQDLGQLRPGYVDLGIYRANTPSGEWPPLFDMRQKKRPGVGGRGAETQPFPSGTRHNLHGR